MAKSIKRTHPADAANIYVRNILCDVSEYLGGFSEQDKVRTKKFFNNECPYTGIKLRANNSVIDHIEGHNRIDAGLHLYGNILICSKEANASKSRKNFEEFLMSNSPVLSHLNDAMRRSKIEKIKAFIKESGYKEKKAKLNETDFKQLINQEYDMLLGRSQEMTETMCKELIETKPIKEAIAQSRREKQDLIKSWSGKKGYNHHTIIALYLDMAKNGAPVSIDDLTDQIAKSMLSKNASGAIRSMMSDRGHNYGRIFFLDDDNLKICPEVEKYIEQYTWYK